MAITDKFLEVSTEQAVTAAAASTNHINFGAARDIGMSKQLYLEITCQETVTSGGSSTVNFQAQVDDNSSFSSAKTVAQSGAIAKASLVAGMPAIYLPLPPGTDEQYFRAYYAVATADLTAGKFTARIVDDVPVNKAYPDAL